MDGDARLERDEVDACGGVGEGLEAATCQWRVTCPIECLEVELDLLDRRVSLRRAVSIDGPLRERASKARRA